MMKTIPLTQGKVALVDDEDFPQLSRFRWCSCASEGRWYAVRRASGRTIRMHREILGLSYHDGRDSDHICGDGLDNRRENLRVATRAQNLQNRRKGSNNTSGVKGVGWHHEKRKWRAYITQGLHQYHLGYFESLTAAAMAYEQAARRLFGEFARPDVSVP